MTASIPYAVTAGNEGGYNGTRVCLKCVLDAVKKHAPELLAEYAGTGAAAKDGQASRGGTAQEEGNK